MVLKILDLNRF